MSDLTTRDQKIVDKWVSLKQSAKSRNIPFSLSLSKVSKLLSRKTCFYTGVRFVENDPELHRSIDRIDSNIGYTDENTVACTVQINRIKSNASYEQLVLLAEGIRKHYSKKGIKLSRREISKLSNKTLKANSKECSEKKQVLPQN